MNKITVTVILLIQAIFVNRAENLVDKYANEGLMARQIPKSEPAVKDYFAKAGMESDTVYALIFPPGNCPRCEAQINALDYELKKIDSKIKTVLISAYPEKNVAQAYNIKHNFKADNYIYDTTEQYKNFLSFSAGYMHIVYLMKVDLNTGTVIAVVEGSDCTSPFTDEFVAYATPLPKKRFKIESAAKPMFQPSNEFLTLERSCPLENPDTIFISETRYPPAFNGEKLFFNDDLASAIYAYRLNEDGKFIFDGIITTDDRENRLFIEVEDKYYDLLLQDNGLRHIPLSPLLTPDGDLAISYSLPHVFHTDHGTIGYMNQASVLTVDTNSYEHKSLIPLVHNHDKFIPHFSIYATPTEIIAGCERMTWPMSFEREEYENTPENNPFADEFYNRRNPIMSAFDSRTGNLKKLFGDLPRHSRLSKTGDYYHSYIFDYHNRETAQSDCVSGVIAITDTTDYNRRIAVYNAFSIPDSIIPAPDPAHFYSYDCATAYKPVFCRTIVDLKLTDDKIHCLVQYGDRSKADIVNDPISYIIVDRSNGTTMEKQFPKCDRQRDKPMAYGLYRQKDDKVYPYALIKSGNKTRLDIYSIMPSASSSERLNENRLN